MKKRFIGILLNMAVIMGLAAFMAMPANAAVRRIVETDCPLLHDKCEKITRFDRSLQDLIEDMYDTVKSKGEGCVGIAASETGILKRVCIIDLGFERYELINPELISSSGEDISFEGCISAPGVFVEIARPAEIEIRYDDINGRSHTMSAEGFLARVILHEMDHLDGIVITDYQ